MYNISLFQILLEEFPYPKMSANDASFQMILSVVLPIIIVGSFSIALPNVIKRVVEEKETGVKVRILLLLFHFILL